MTRKRTRSYRDDYYDGDDLHEAIERGEVGYCEINQHHDWSDNIHGYTLLHDPTDTISFCDDCEPEALCAVVEVAIAANLTHAEALQCAAARINDGHYDADTGERLIEAIEARALRTRQVGKGHVDS